MMTHPEALRGLATRRAEMAYIQVPQYELIHPPCPPCPAVSLVHEVLLVQEEDKQVAMFRRGRERQTSKHQAGRHFDMKCRNTRAKGGREGK